MTSLACELEALTLEPKRALCHNVIASHGEGKSGASTEDAPCLGACGCGVLGAAGELRKPRASDAPQPPPETPVREAVSKISNPGTSLVEGWARVKGRGEGETLRAPIPLASDQAGSRLLQSCGIGGFLRPHTHPCLPWEGAEIPRLLPLLPVPRPGCAPGLDGVKVSASISTIFPRGHVNKCARF